MVHPGKQSDTREWQQPYSPAEWASLGGPPSFDTVTRDTYPPGTVRTAAEIVAVARGLASAGAALHAAGVTHGDMYAHNTLFRSAAVAAALPASGNGGGCTNCRTQLWPTAWKRLVSTLKP
jgi:hypothetical protein